ncbi:MAG: hypothetical protein AABX24_00535 [Nanoarchaeota archaeon]
MYHTSHQGLEYITQGTPIYNPSSCSPSNSLGNSFSQPFYSITATPNYDDGMFIPSRDASFRYSIEKERSLPYSLQQENYIFHTPKPEYHFVPENFLKPGKEGLFVGKAEEVREFVEETFEKIFQRSFPNAIKMSIMNREEFRKIAPSSNTIGLSLNRSQQGLLSEIFVLNDTLGRVMLTIGHELGHVLTKTLLNPHDEEAKAYAFSLLWMKVIRENNIANLGEAIITEQPAGNGLHNISFAFVHDLIVQGKKPEEIYELLLAQELTLLPVQN